MFFFLSLDFVLKLVHLCPSWILWPLIKPSPEQLLTNHYWVTVTYDCQSFLFLCGTKVYLQHYSIVESNTFEECALLQFIQVKLLFRTRTPAAHKLLLDHADRRQVEHRGTMICAGWLYLSHKKVTKDTNLQPDNKEAKLQIIQCHHVKSSKLSEGIFVMFRHNFLRSHSKRQIKSL